MMGGASLVSWFRREPHRLAGEAPLHDIQIVDSRWLAGGPVRRATRVERTVTPKVEKWGPVSNSAGDGDPSGRRARARRGATATRPRPVEEGGAAGGGGPW